MAAPKKRSRAFTIIAQDPSVKIDGKILRGKVAVPAERLGPGPRGYRLHVIDYDASTGTLYEPIAFDDENDPSEGKSDEALLHDPGFHAHNVYAIVMCTLARFEYALGRRCAWSFHGHQLKAAPHAFAAANAFYSEQDQALMFGYFPGISGEMVYTCLSHDVIAHETTHALLDGLRTRYTDPSSPDQAAFHEGFADVIALLSLFAQTSVVGAMLGNARTDTHAPALDREGLGAEALRQSAALFLAEQIGKEMRAVRGGALRQSARIEASTTILDTEEFLEPHRRGEVLVAAMLHAFTDAWARRLEALGSIVTDGRQLVDRERIVEEGANIADHLVKISIRALDYAPPVDLRFGDYLSALLTADTEISADDSKYEFRNTIARAFGSFGILPAANAATGGVWDPPDTRLDYDRVHFESLRRDPDEVFRFLWENRQALALYEGAYCRVQSVRPCVRQGPDGFFLRETAAEYVQVLRLKASELYVLNVRKPPGMDDEEEVRLYGGGVLIFDEFGKLKFHVSNRLDSTLQTERLAYLWEAGFFDGARRRGTPFSELHLQRATAVSTRFHFGGSK